MDENIWRLWFLLLSKIRLMIYFLNSTMILTTMISLTLSWLLLPLDHDLVVPTTESIQEAPVPFLEWTASWYDYSLPNVKWGNNRSRTHSTCAVRIMERYQTFKVCSDVTWKCIECYHNDYGPQSSDRVIDLSSYAFRSLWVPLSRGLTPVKVYLM